MTKSLIAISSALVLTVTMPLAALAQSASNVPATPANDAEVEARFKAADKNGDGKVTREEAEAGLPRVAMAWEKIDVDKKGYITLEQLQFIAANNR
ncbi:MAG: EF-hand domain-containing protein [Burkholderiaceae bacterium]|nr:EF-hand domain-containing protein [Burkholderiaceae bacterium]MCD8538014.1 EF-hand domain-containing protein [Burkholderiaceae bacterium]MCD8564195.1 EF-hand domain-containing protein [Burkholderiaceae bacterium]